MDETDRKIIEELKENSRKSNVEIARTLDISEGAVRNRIENLVEKDILERFTVDVSTEEKFKAFSLVKIKPGVQTPELIEKLNDIGVEKIHETAGEWDLLLETRANSPKEFNRLIDQARAEKGIMKTESLAVLEEHY